MLNLRVTQDDSMRILVNHGEHILVKCECGRYGADMNEPPLHLGLQRGPSRLS